MNTYSLDMYNAFQPEDRKRAGELFPEAGFQPGECPTVSAAAAFAETLGISADYKRLLTRKHDGEDVRVYLGHFQNNLDLLIRKTWVEKADESRKEALQSRIPALITAITSEEYQKALKELGKIVEELAYLFFGSECEEADFIEYALRIDTSMGLFWWYGSKLSGEGCLEWTQSAEKGILLAVLLLGICYLTDF